MLNKIVAVISVIVAVCSTVVMVGAWTISGFQDLAAGQTMPALQFFAYDVAWVASLLHLHINQNFFGITVDTDKIGPS